MSIATTLKINDSIRTKTFEMNGHTFKVKVPLGSELDSINKRIISPTQEAIDARFAKMSANLKDADIEGIEHKDGDIIIDGNSIKKTVTSVLQMETKITEYFKLLIAEQGTLENITYDEIDGEFPLQTQFEFLEKITEVIQPNYKDARKN
jgi:excinuclease UvrABC ATPase subunit